MDLNKEQLQSIIEAYQADFTYGFEQTCKAIYVEDVPMMIKEALALAEKTKWKYPDKGELPEINKPLDFVVPHYPGRHVGRFARYIEDDLCFWCELAKTYFSIDKVKAWTYAPVLDEEPLPRSERLEKLTAERDALLEEDQ